MTFGKLSDIAYNLTYINSGLTFFSKQFLDSYFSTFGLIATLSTGPSEVLSQNHKSFSNFGKLYGPYDIAYVEI